MAADVTCPATALQVASLLIPANQRAGNPPSPGRRPRQRLAWEVRKDGSALVRPVPSVMELAGSLKSHVPFSSIAAETEAATSAWASESIKPKRR